MPRAILAATASLAVLGLLTVAPHPVWGQDPAPVHRPVTVVVTGEASVTVVPDQGRIDLAVETRGGTARAAARANASVQQAVIQAIVASGIPRTQIATLDIGIAPEYRTVPNGAPQVAGYRATNTVRIEVTRLDQVSTIVDTAVAAGATRVASYETWSTQAVTARRTALTAAVAAARADAVAAAAGAGLVVDGLVEMSVQSAMPGPVAFGYGRVQAMAMADAVPTPVEAGTRQVRATVTTTWKLKDPLPQ